MKSIKKLEELGYDLIKKEDEELLFRKSIKINHTSDKYVTKTEHSIRIVVWAEHVDFYIIERDMNKRSGKMKRTHYEYGQASFKELEVINELIKEIKEGRDENGTKSDE